MTAKAKIKRIPKPRKPIEVISNGFGGQSIYMLYLAATGAIPAQYNFCADTGSETDCTLNDGSKISAREFYFGFIEPFCKKNKIESYFIRSVDNKGVELPPLRDYIEPKFTDGAPDFGQLPVPMFGSKGGRRAQTCTDKWKIRAMRQQARRLGATSMRSAVGIHAAEAWRRIKGVYLRKENGFDIYQTVSGVDRKTKLPKIIKWQTHFYPLVDFRLNREQIRERLEKLKLPYLVSSECDFCPHQDLPRWERRAPETINWIAELESRFQNEYFFTDRRRPLLKALELWRISELQKAAQGNLFETELDFGCGNNVCGI